MFAAAVQGSAAVAPTCDYRLQNPGSGHFDLGSRVVDLGEGDSAAQPQAWQGPLSILESGKAICKSEDQVALIERPIYHNNEYLLVTTYSGSNRRVFAIRLADCTIAASTAAFSGSVSLKSDILHVGKKAIKLDSRCLP
jgi:hypothetical protein